MGRPKGSKNKPKEGSAAAARRKAAPKKRTAGGAVRRPPAPRATRSAGVKPSRDILAEIATSVATMATMYNGVLQALTQLSNEHAAMVETNDQMAQAVNRVNDGFNLRIEKLESAVNNIAVHLELDTATKPEAPAVEAPTANGAVAAAAPAEEAHPQ